MSLSWTARLSMPQQEGQSLDLMHAKSWINRLGGDLPGPAGTRFMRSFSVETVGTLQGCMQGTMQAFARQVFTMRQTMEHGVNAEGLIERICQTLAAVHGPLHVKPVRTIHDGMQRGYPLRYQ